MSGSLNSERMLPVERLDSSEYRNRIWYELVWLVSGSMVVVSLVRTSVLVVLIVGCTVPGALLDSALWTVEVSSVIGIIVVVVFSLVSVG